MSKDTRTACMAGLALLLAAAATTIDAQPLTWRTIVNNADLMPGSNLTFNSFNQPSVNANGMVVFRARSKGSAGGGEAGITPVPGVEISAVPSIWSSFDAPGAGPVHGIYVREAPVPRYTPPIIEITARGKPVPQPNNTLYNGALATFEEFPSMPRIDILSPMIATRGQSQPVYEYQTGIDPITGLPVTTRVGSSGIYANPGGALLTGASLLGAVRDFPANTVTFPQYSVPGVEAGTRFDQFPGAPAVTNGTVIAFKGNYTDPADQLGKTGVYYRDVAANAGHSATQMVARTGTVIPNPPGAPTATFGSTAPPSAANGYMVFTGLDIEDAPTRGGIYRAPLQPSPALQTLVGIGDQVPGEMAGVAFNAFGEGLSISSDARFVSFWGAWGTETFGRVLYCPTDGNAEVIAYCQDNYPAGHSVQIPVHQGIFVADALTGKIYPVAKTLADGYTDFLYWVFSGRPPGTGGGDEPSLEPPRWRSSAFSALNGVPGWDVQTAFKATKSGYDGIYVRQGRSLASPLVTVADTQNTTGQSIDPMAPANSVVTAVGIERDGFRNGNLVIAAAMLYDDPITPLGWAGLYLTKVPAVQVPPETSPAPVLVSAASRKYVIVLRQTVPYALPLSLDTANPTTEPRTGPTQELVFTFDKAVIAGTATVTAGTGQVTGVSFRGNDMTVKLGSVADAKYLTLTVSKVKSGASSDEGGASVRVGFLRGDTNQDRIVTSADSALVSTQIGVALSNANYLLDVNVSGAISAADVAMVDANLSAALPAP
jgi:hypothetical protein